MAVVTIAAAAAASHSTQCVCLQRCAIANAVITKIKSETEIVFDRCSSTYVRTHYIRLNTEFCRQIGYSTPIYNYSNGIYKL